MTMAFRTFHCLFILDLANEALQFWENPKFLKVDFRVVKRNWGQGWARWSKFAKKIFPYSLRNVIKFFLMVLLKLKYTSSDLKKVHILRI